MMILFPIIAFFLVQSSLAFLEDAYPESVDNYGSYPEDPLDTDNDIEVHRPSNHFLRFGRNNGKYDNNDPNYEDYDDFARPTRSGKIEKNDHFIRFGRGRQQDFLRFGRDSADQPPQRPVRDKGIYLRFGRSIAEEETAKKRSKRQTFPEELSKRSDAFLRFGRNSNFMRFGRDPANFLTVPTSSIDTHPSSTELLKMKQLQHPDLIHLLSRLMSYRQTECKPCPKAA